MTGTETPEIVPAPVPPAGADAYRIHVVEAEEDLYSVAMLWGVSVSDLKQINKLTDTDLEEGQKIKIPIGE